MGNSFLPALAYRADNANAPRKIEKGQGPRPTLSVVPRRRVPHCTSCLSAPSPLRSCRDKHASNPTLSRRAPVASISFDQPPSTHSPSLPLECQISWPSLCFSPPPCCCTPLSYCFASVPADKGSVHLLPPAAARSHLVSHAPRWFMQSTASRKICSVQKGNKKKRKN